MERKLTAILSADVKGYSRLMGEDEEATLRTLNAYRKVIDTLIAQHRGSRASCHPCSQQFSGLCDVGCDFEFHGAGGESY